MKLLFFLVNLQLIRSRKFTIRFFPARLERPNQYLGDLSRARILYHDLISRRTGIFAGIHLYYFELELVSKKSILIIK
jgi:hypothetical protein